MCIRDSHNKVLLALLLVEVFWSTGMVVFESFTPIRLGELPVSYTHLRAHETVLDLVCRLLLEKKKKQKP